MEQIDNPKLQQIYSMAKSLFMRYGIKRVSIEEICQEAGVSKMTFYRHFSNKVELLKFLLEKMISESIARYNEIMKQDISFSKKIKQTIQLKLEQTNGLSQEFFADIHKNADSEIKDFINQKAEESFQLVLHDYVAAQKRGEVRPDIKPEFILYFLNHILQMVNDEQLVRLYDSPQDLIIELTNFFFYGILSRHDHENESNQT